MSRINVLISNIGAHVINTVKEIHPITTSSFVSVDTISKAWPRQAPICTANQRHRLCLAEQRVFGMKGLVLC